MSVFQTAHDLVNITLLRVLRCSTEQEAPDLPNAHRELKAQGYGLIIHDGYRPWYVTKILDSQNPSLPG